MTRPAPSTVEQPPWWLPLGVGVVLTALLATMALPLYGYGTASWSRSLFLGNLILWLLPLTWLQRLWWRRGLSLRRTWLMLLPLTLAMVLATKSIYFLALRKTTDIDWLWRGLEAPWLALLAYAALHAAITHAWALRVAGQRVQQAERLTREAQLQALQLQLQPHFLFNTLNAVSAEVGDGRTSVAQQMLARLGDLLRATLELSGRPTHSLAAELALAEAYLDLERARLSERMRVEWQVGPCLLDADLPTLSLQPLLENAIRHGLAPRRQPGRLRVRIWREQNELRIEIVNDLPETLPLQSSSSGLGLANLRDRLTQLYGTAATLQTRIDGGQFWLGLRLPWREAGSA